MMEQRLSLVTLGVRDIARSRRFYEALGWRGHEIEQTVFFQAGGLAVVLWGRDLLVADCGLVDDAPHASFGGIALAHNVRARHEVDDVLALVPGAGGRVTKPAAETFYGGYAAYFVDPDGHPWEVAHNPGFTIDESGALLLPFGDA